MQSTHEIRQKPTLPGDSRAINISLSTTFRGITLTSASADPGCANRSRTKADPGPAGRFGGTPAASGRPPILEAPESPGFALGAIVPGKPFDGRPSRPRNELRGEGI